MISAALASVFRRIESGDIDLPGVPEPDPGVPGLDAFFGVCPNGWTPECESGRERVELYCTLDPQEVVVEYSCPTCRDGDVLPESLCCMRCMRSRHDDRIKAILRDYPPPRHGEMGPAEKAEADAARAQRRKDAAKAARAKPKAGSDACLMGTATLAKFAS